MRVLESAPIGPSPSTNSENRTLRRERDELKEAVNNFETELMQVCVCVCVYVWCYGALTLTSYSMEISLIEDHSQWKLF